jgi:hypothetical protein
MRRVVDGNVLRAQPKGDAGANRRRDRDGYLGREFLDQWYNLGLSARGSLELTGRVLASSYAHVAQAKPDPFCERYDLSVFPRSGEDLYAFVSKLVNQRIEEQNLLRSEDVHPYPAIGHRLSQMVFEYFFEVI